MRAFIKNFIQNSTYTLRSSSENKLILEGLDVEETLNEIYPILEDIALAQKNGGDDEVCSYLFNALEDKEIMGNMAFEKGQSKSILMSALNDENAYNSHPYAPLFVEVYKHSEELWGQTLRAPGSATIAADAIAGMLTFHTGPGSLLAAGIASIIVNEIEHENAEDPKSEEEKDESSSGRIAVPVDDPETIHVPMP